MAKKRVHEIAKERGLPSKEVLAKLQAAGFDVKAAASSVEEADVARAFGEGANGGDAKPAAKEAKAKAPAKKAAAKGARRRRRTRAPRRRTRRRPRRRTTPTPTSEAEPKADAAGSRPDPSRAEPARGRPAQGARASPDRRPAGAAGAW